MTGVVLDINDARSLGSYARRYAARGWHVMPLWWAHEVDGQWRCACGNPACKSPAKHPISAAVPQGQNSATTEPSRIAAWWHQYPQANIGVVLAPSHLVAIDIDPRNGGLDTIAAVEARRGPLESDILQFTGGGGEHRVFSVPAGQSISVPGSLGPGVDVKHHGYIVVEPSRHISGQRYAWEASSDPLEGATASPLPDWLRSVRHELEPPAVSVRAIDQAQLEDLQSALSAIGADNRDTWLRVGMALHSTGDDQQGFTLWSTWSQSSAKFDPVDQMRVWRSFRRRGLDGVSPAWIFAQAQANGWTNPRSNAAKGAPAPIIVQADPMDAGPEPDVVQQPDTPADLLTVPGALAMAVDWINATARKPQPLLAVQAAIALGSVVLGRRYRTTNGNWSMLYLLNVAQSGAGKEHAKFAVETLLEAAGLSALIGAGRFASESSVTSALIEKPAHFSVLDEFGKMLQSASVTQNFADRNTLKALMEVWGRADGVMRPVAYSTAGLSSKQAEELAKRLVRKPSLTILAMATGETLFGGLTSAAVADGFLGRFLTVHADRGRQMASPVKHVEPPARLVDWIQAAHAGVNRSGNMAALPAAHDMEPVPIAVEFDGGALATFAALEQRTHARMDELDSEGMAEMLARITETAMRLSLIVALSCDSLTITRAHAQWACEYVEHHSDRNIQMLRERLSEGPFDQLCKEVRRLVVKAGGKGMTERDLDKASRTWRANPDRMRQDALSSLRRREEITLVDMKPASGRGRARQAYMDSALVNNADNADKTPTGASPNET